MHSIYIGQLLRPAAAPLIVCMHVCLGVWLWFVIIRTLHGGVYLKWKTVYYFMNHFLLPYIILECIVFDLL